LDTVVLIAHLPVCRGAHLLLPPPPELAHLLLVVGQRPRPIPREMSFHSTPPPA